MNQQQLAECINVSVEYINHIIQCKQAITADLALRLSRYFSLSPQFWLNLQRHYDLEIAEDKLSNRLTKEEVEQLHYTSGDIFMQPIFADYVAGIADFKQNADSVLEQAQTA
ncbi:MAG: addiction module antidote protein, HigA family [Gammaproteobacteria bacterium]|nr:MAG: addiction module antidote protein, HigA family [Gammaproteobacteria bacterium]RKZ74571.1 MAG: addiction module antidote protein, HigA family [Gammaproteobacteria bacterium]